MGTLRLATRGSPLALRQTELVGELLRTAHPELDVEPVVVRTRGDQDAESPLDEIGGQGVFVTEVEAAVRDGRADAAVHSAKDMPSIMVADLVLSAVPRRADARDGLVGCTLGGLPPGALVATGSARRRAQLAWLRPDLVFTQLRGNMARRVAVGESDDVTAVVVAVAAMDRLGWRDRLTDVLDPVDMLPQAGQGAVALQCRADDTATRKRLARIDDESSHLTLHAERAVLAALGGSCSVPVGAHAVLDADGGMEVTGLAASGDGRTVIRLSRRGPAGDPEELGTSVARDLLEGGAYAIEGFPGLDAIPPAP